MKPKMEAKDLGIGRTMKGMYAQKISENQRAFREKWLRCTRCGSRDVRMLYEGKAKRERVCRVCFFRMPPIPQKIKVKEDKNGN